MGGKASSILSAEGGSETRLKGRGYVPLEALLLLSSSDTPVNKDDVEEESSPRENDTSQCGHVFFKKE